MTPSERPNENPSTASATGRMADRSNIVARARLASEPEFPWIERPGWALHGDPEVLNAAMQHLATCENHGGVHHFARIKEGEEIVCSRSAVVCLGLATVI